ncbi:DnaJ domain-containing protein [Candidatus Gracilibacteria bacterium]|nr:DnaJ domain-containing protein [Candidatus Gracilibacteria bacterium]
MPENYYDILGISKNATSDEIKRAYRAKAMEHHPDRHGGDKSKEADFKKVNEAYSILSDSQKRAHYDRYGSMDGMGGFNQGFNQGFNMDFDLSEIFETFFGGSEYGSGKRRKNESGENLEFRINLNFADAIFGIKKTIKFERKIVCKTCGGAGNKPGTGMKTCTTCHGSGHIKKRVQSFFGVVEKTEYCSACDGEGVIIEQKCSACFGEKRINEKIEKEVEIPAGVDDGMTLKLKGEGNESIKGKSGDLYIVFKVPSDLEGLKRDGDDLHYSFDIEPVEAILGTKKKIKIPVLGDRIVEIKPGTQYGEILKFKGDGVKNVNTDYKGDLFLKLILKTPTRISKKEKELYQKIAEEKGININKSIFEKMFE